MSVFCEFHKAWKARFPGHELPGAWEEDVRANLSKHRARATLLQEELEKEQFYVDYLERLLEDVRRHKGENDRSSPPVKTAGEERGQGEGSELVESPKANHKFFSTTESLVSEAINSALGKDAMRAVLGALPPTADEPSSPPLGSSVRDLARKFSPTPTDSLSPVPSFFRSTSVPASNGARQQSMQGALDESQFVTVIPINGSPRDDRRPRRVPPVPPPKTFRRPVSTGVDMRPDFDGFERSPKNSQRPRAPLPPLSSTKLPPNDDDKCPVRKTPSSASSASNASMHSLSKSSSNGSSIGKPPSNDQRSPSNESLDDNLTDDEPIYDTVAPDEPADTEEECGKSDYNGTDTFKSGTSGASSSDGGLVRSQGSASPGSGLDRSSDSQKSSNYVNLDFFLHKTPLRSDADDSDEDRVPSLLRTLSSDQEELKDEPFDIDSGVYGSSVESTTNIPSAPPSPVMGFKKTDADESETTRQVSLNDEEAVNMHKCILSSIIESETVYLECLDVVLQYMKALKATLTTSQPVISPDDFSTVFYRIPELHAAHSTFLQGLRQKPDSSEDRQCVGRMFKNLAAKLDVYAQFLQNYQRAVETVRRCSSICQQFADITKTIKLRSLQGQAQSLEDLLHRPVARVQKNALVLHDFLKYTPEQDPNYADLKEALNLTQNFLTHLSLMQAEAMFPAPERPQRHLVRNSFIVELAEGQRKLRHLFLFNDVLVCAKYKATGRPEKFTFEVKWYISLHNIMVVGENIFETVRENSPPNLVALKSQASTVRDQLKRQESVGDSKGGNRINLSKSDKRKKKLAELEAQLILASPNLPLRIGKRAGLTYTFLLTSEYERDQWGETIKVLQANTPGVGGSSLTLNDIQNWITAYRSFLKTNMGSFLLKSCRDESLLIGDLHIVVSSLHGLTSPSNMFLCFEVDSYGHFFRKAKTKCSNGIEPVWKQDFIIDLEGSQILRILCYEDHPTEGIQLRGKVHLELSRSWLNNNLGERRVSLQDLVLVISLKFLPPEATLRGLPVGKSSGLFGAALTNVCRREKRSVPFVVTRCVREVERRGLCELGIYRVSGLASDINKMKKSFESNPYEAEQLVKEVDINAVTGLLKLYMRELPEALFTDDLYPRFFEAYSSFDADYKKTTLLKLFTSLPLLNQSLIVYLLEHLVKINRQENVNKMSLHNLATVFGPTLLRPALNPNTPTLEEQLTASTVDVMAQAGILHFFLKRRANGEPIQVVQS